MAKAFSTRLKSGLQGGRTRSRWLAASIKVRTLGSVGAGDARPGPGLVDAEEALGIGVELAVEPGLPAPRDGGLILLAGTAFMTRRRRSTERVFDMFAGLVPRPVSCSRPNP